jgi:hypothetical protein
MREILLHVRHGGSQTSFWCLKLEGHRLS